MRSSIVGTTVAVVMPSSATRRTHSAGSNLVRYTIFRPAYRLDSAALDARDVIRRHTDQCRVLGRRRAELHGAGHVARQVVVRQLDGLGSRGGAGGEQHDGDRRRGRRIRLPARRCGRTAMNSSRGDHLLARARDDVEVLGIGDDQRGGQAVDQFAQSVGAQPVVQRGDRHGGPRRGEEQQRQHGPAGADVGDVLRARRRDDPGPAVGKRAEFVCGQPDIAGDHCRPVRIARGSHLEQQRDAHDLSTKISRMGSSPPP